MYTPGKYSTTKLDHQPQHWLDPCWELGMGVSEKRTGSLRPRSVQLRVSMPNRVSPQSAWGELRDSVSLEPGTEPLIEIYKGAFLSYKIAHLRVEDTGRVP